MPTAKAKRKMIYTDRVYGTFEIKEPVILDLISTRAMQRLKGIDQYGYSKPFFKIKQSANRFNHSLGVYFLLKEYKASFEEQIAGIIHDVSHSVFSHSIDHILDSGSQKEQNHQDNILKEFIFGTEIPSILTKYNLDVDYILNDKNFPLKEKDLPDLCADRIDYTFRDALVFKETEKKDVNYFLSNLIIENSKWVFKNLESAQRYANLFFILNIKDWTGLPSALMFGTVGDCLRHAIKKGYISEIDLYKTDKDVLDLIKKHIKKDKKLNLLFKRMNGGIPYENNPNDYHNHLFCKSRIVDPLLKQGNKIVTLSVVNPKWAKVVEIESKPKEYFIKFAR